MQTCCLYNPDNLGEYVFVSLIGFLITKVTYKVYLSNNIILHSDIMLNWVIFLQRATIWNVLCRNCGCFKFLIIYFNYIYSCIIDFVYLRYTANNETLYNNEIMVDLTL